MWDWDIFISYAHIDNQPYGDEKGWIDYLHERLDTRLAQLLGKPLKIWRDRKLSGNDVFDDEIKDTLKKTAVFVAVMSPRYIQSVSCQQEVADFTHFAQTQGGLRIGNKLRVFKVIKTEISHKSHPSEWQALLGYEFYGEDPVSKKTREFNHELTGPQRDTRYWGRLEDLAHDIKETLLTLPAKTTTPAQGILDPQQSAPQPLTVSSGLTVYLAETTSDLSAERDSLKREWQQRGHRVVPDQTNITAERN